MKQIRENVVAPLVDIGFNPGDNGLPNLGQVAGDLYKHFRWTENHDLELDFPGSIAGYGGSVEGAYQRLLERRLQMQYNPERNKYFVALKYVEASNSPMYGRLRAVGLGLMKVLERHTPPNESIDPQSPNISLLVCHPYRSQGIGRLLMDAQLEVVHKRYGGRAWTAARPENSASQALLTRVGFAPVGQTTRRRQTYLYYSYQAQPTLTDR